MATFDPAFSPASRPRRTCTEFVEGILAGDRTILGQSITLLESARSDHQELGQQIIEAILPHSGKSFRLGVTGVPGVGKSTFIEAFGKLLLQQAPLSGGRGRLAVLAIDPSSARSGGSILGDKTRMVELSRDERVFIRPSPAADSLGGVARRTRECIMLCEAAGYDTILVETVGVGQSETAVHSMTDFFLLLMLSGAGDELQGIKRGIMEMADAIAITKADGDNVLRARAAAAEYRAAVHLFPRHPSEQRIETLTCSAQSGEGLNELAALLRRYRESAIASGYFLRRRSEQTRYWFQESVMTELKSALLQKPLAAGAVAEMEEAALAGRLSPFRAAQQAVARALSLAPHA
ncbi:MAG: methylmalonyl Co-A mutase-associated GTPase MeaB [Leptospirales bacterium]|nr:methylmalonyl Co-A mutase-associated GTPase MeaB [Leptospirales bacterium]